jgi:hypothetical protein
MIVKIQRPLATNTEPTALVYNQDHSVFFQWPYTDEVAALFADGSLKVYVHARLIEGNLHVGERVTEQDW